MVWNFPRISTSLWGSIINVNDAGMEFISIDGLLFDLPAEDIRNGISQSQNRKLAEIFYRLGLIESYGTGIRRIFGIYKDSSVQPQLQMTPNTFKLFLPNMNAAEQLSQIVAYVQYRRFPPRLHLR